MLSTQTTSSRAILHDVPPPRPAPTAAHGYIKGDTVLMHAGSAWPVTVRDLVDRRDGLVLTMREAGVIAGQRPSAFIAHEPAQLYRLTTRSGRRIEATANRPFLTHDGWIPLLELDASDRVAVVTEYPELFGRGDADTTSLKLLAYLTALGTSGDGATPVIRDVEVHRDVVAAVQAKGDAYVELIEESGTRIRVLGRQDVPCKTLSYLIVLGAHGVCDRDKAIPDLIFGLRKEKLRLFLNRLFTCDGTPERSGLICYRSASIRVVRQVQHLLARFGIASVVGDPGQDAGSAAAALWIDRKPDVVRFIDQIGFFGDKALQAEFIRAALYDLREANLPRDRIGSVLFDRVVSIEETEIAPVYDLTIEGSHNFVANDFLVHNDGRWRP